MNEITERSQNTTQKGDSDLQCPQTKFHATPAILINLYTIQDTLLPNIPFLVLAIWYQRGQNIVRC